MYVPSSFTYRFKLVNVISLGLALSEPILGGLLCSPEIKQQLKPFNGTNESDYN